jgi:hypothetical protein
MNNFFDINSIGELWALFHSGEASDYEWSECPCWGKTGVSRAYWSWDTRTGEALTIEGDMVALDMNLVDWD